MHITISFKKSFRVGTMPDKPTHKYVYILHWMYFDVCGFFFLCVLIIHSISEGCTLKLVLAMRGGPINTSRGRHMFKLRILKQFDSSNLQARWSYSLRFYSGFFPFYYVLEEPHLFLSAFFLIYLFLLKYGWFTVLC